MFIDIPLVQIMIKTGNPRYKIGGLNIQFIFYLGFYLIKQLLTVFHHLKHILPLLDPAAPNIS